MVGCPFITKHRHLWERFVHAKPRIILEDGAQHPLGCDRFSRAMEFIVEIRHGQMHFSVQRICRWRNGGCISHPH
ncbi:hypothetical protein D3C78_1855350 [compost metagenome]